MWIEKTLTNNDLGLNASHQSGIHIPLSKMHALPELTRAIKNPRYNLNLIDGQGGCWPVSLIYYNNKFHGGTRNEVRLTGTIHCFREHACIPGDVIRLHFTSEQVIIKIQPSITAETSSSFENLRQVDKPGLQGRAGSNGPEWSHHTIRKRNS